MAKLNKKLLIPASIAGLMLGYLGAEWAVPRYFHPPPATKITPHNVVSFIGSKPFYTRQTIAGNYLAGQFAQNQRNWKDANKFISKILKIDPKTDNKTLKGHAMILAMSSGNGDIAIKRAKEIIKTEPNNVLANLFLIIEKFRNENYTDVKDTIANVGEDSLASFITPLLQVWADTSTGNISTTALSQTNIYAYHAMLAGLFTEDTKAVKAYVERTYTANGLDLRDAEKMADILYQYGYKDQAKFLYQSLLDQNINIDRISPKMDLLKADKPIINDLQYPIVTSPKQGAAYVFADMAEILSRENSNESATVFSQMALTLAPDLVRPKIILADIFSKNKSPERAIEVLSTIQESAAEFDLIQRQIASYLTDMDREEEAIALLQSLNEDATEIDTLNQIGDIYRYDEKFEKAVQSYSKIVKQFDVMPKKYWYVLYARGMSYERLGKIDKAVADLQKAIELQPNHASLLNYLGYTWADQGENLEEALELIQKAVELAPMDGYITDSLGWVHYRLGNFSEAVEALERAVELLPYDSTINDHLGDAYWQVGRITEARFQWRRAVNYMEDEDLELKTKLENKIANGLLDHDTKLSGASNQPVPNEASDTQKDVKIIQ